MSNYIVSDSDLTSVANAIRTKGGTSAQLAFPAGFVSAIGDIPSGGGGNPSEDLIKFIKNTLTSISDDTVTYIRNNMFHSASALVTVDLPNVTSIGSSAFISTSNLSKAFFPKATLGIYCFQGSGIQYAVFLGNQTYNNQFQNCSHLIGADMISNNGGVRSAEFLNCSVLNILVLRYSAGVVALQNVNAFNGTPFANGGTGGTIYIPKSLYDHLGDGTSSDYKAASNWSTVNGYGTITWAKIEGSYYETHYADGTAIPTT